MLVPMYFLIGIWGGGRRLYSAIKFFLYTLAGSVVMLLGILALYFYAPRRRPASTRFDIPQLPRPRDARRRCRSGSSSPSSRLRDQGADVPVPHLAARRARRGADGGLDHPRCRPAEDGHLRLRALRLPILPDGTRALRADRGGCSRSSASSTARWSRWRRRTGRGWSPTRRQPHRLRHARDVRAQSDGPHRQHRCRRSITAISTGALFLLVGIVYERRHTREIADYGGLSKVMPVFAALFLVMALSSIGLPGAERLHRRVPDPAGRFVVTGLWAAARRSASSSAPPTCCGCTSDDVRAGSTIRRTRRCPT